MLNKFFPIPFLSLISLILITAFSFSLKSNLNELNTFKYGKTVNVLITDITGHCREKGRMGSSEISFNYKGKTYNRRIKDEWCNKLKTDSKTSILVNNNLDIYIFPWENTTKIKNELIIGIIGIIFLTICFLKGYYTKFKNK